MRPLRVVVADDSDAVRGALRRLLAGVGCQVVGEAVDSDGLLATAGDCGPDVALVDLWLADGSAVLAVRALRSRRPPVPTVLLSAAPASQVALAAAVSGCAGRLAKLDLRAQDLVTLLRRAAAPPAAASEVGREPSADAEPVLALLLDGRSDEEIATLLDVEPVNAGRLVSDVLDQLGLGRAAVRS